MTNNILNCVILGLGTALVVVLNFYWSVPVDKTRIPDPSEIHKLAKAEEIFEEPMEVVGLLTDFDYSTVNFFLRSVAYLFYLG